MRLYLELFLITGFFLFIQGCSENSTGDAEESPPQSLMETINSAGVAFSYTGELQQAFFNDPGRGYISGYFYFEDDLADDIIFGLDMEWMEGVENPVHFEGADWMSLAGFTREGILFFPIGSPENLEGVPTNTDTWEVRDIGTPLQPQTWYKMTIISDFGKREFESVQLQGGEIDTLIDISGFPLEYPNFIPFDKPSLTFYTFALRGREFAPENPGGYSVFFDDIEGGIWNENGFETTFSNGFESQTQIQDVPFTLPVSPLEDVLENVWYFENDDAKIRITDIHARTGAKSMECRADLQQVLF